MSYNAFGINLILAGVKQAGWAALAVVLLAVSTLGQTTTTSSTDGATPLVLSPGAPAGSYALSDIEVINPANGHLNIRIPLVQAGGRGGAQATLMLAMDLQPWRVTHRHSVDPKTGVETDTYSPTANRWGGITPGYGLGVLQGRRSGIGSVLCPLHVNRHYTQTLTRLTFTAQDGTEYELRDQLTSGKPATFANVCDPGSSRGTVFVTADGTSATFISDSAITDPAYTDDAKTFTPSGYLMLREGTHYRIDSGLVSWMRDRNGNTLTASYDTFVSPTVITDSLNRQIIFAYGVDDGASYGVCDRITVKGFGGEQRFIRVSNSNLGSVLRGGFALATYQQLFPGLNGTGTYDPTVPSVVWLPNGRSYRFLYDSYGEVALCANDSALCANDSETRTAL